MKTLALTSLIILLGTISSTCQEIYAKQYWALVGDANADNWVDPGDTISITVDISYYDALSPVVSFHNNIEDPYLQLVSGSISSLSGTVSQGNNRDDQIISVKDIQLTKAIERGLVTFQCVVRAQRDGAPHDDIVNQSAIHSIIGKTTTNQINIQVKPLSTTKNVTYLDNITTPNVLLICIGILGVGLGFLYQRIRKMRLSY